MQRCNIGKKEKKCNERVFVSLMNGFDPAIDFTFGRRPVFFTACFKSSSSSSGSQVEVIL